MNIERMIVGFKKLQIISAFFQMKLPRLLKNGSMHVEEAAKNVGLKYGEFIRLVRCFLWAGLIKIDKKERIRLTYKGKKLAKYSDVETAWLYGQANTQYKVWGELYNSFMQSDIAFEKLYGQNYFEYSFSNDEHHEAFHNIMSRDTEEIIPELMELDFSRFNKIYDIGGGDGTLLLHMANRYRKKEFTIYEKEGMQKIIMNRIEGVGNVKLEIGDFFEYIPADGDLYIMKCILHDWNDEKCLDILKRCERIMREDSALLIIEHILPNKFVKDSYSVSSDISMKLLLDGKERTYEDFAGLLEKSGLEVYNKLESNKGYGFIFAKKK